LVKEVWFPFPGVSALFPAGRRSVLLVENLIHLCYNRTCCGRRVKLCIDSRSGKDLWIILITGIGSVAERLVNMHIPDGYLGPSFSIPFIGAILPIWSIALRKTKQAVSLRQLPLMSLCAAFSFLIMMFNIPLGPSSVHAVGAVLIAIILGPWAASITVSVALIIQAVIFQDGGILAIGANCINMAVAMPFAGYFTYRLIAGNAPLLSKRNTAGIFIGSFVGINTAALLTALEFGLQPLLFRTAEGLPQYGFYPLSIAVPAIMLEHLLVAGPVEGIVTVSAVAYLMKFNPRIFDKTQTGDVIVGEGSVGRYKGFLLGLLVLLLLTPLGLFASGTAWGEWGIDEIRGMTGSVPEGLEHLSRLWGAVIPDYAIPALGGGFLHTSAGYILSAVVGVLIITAVILISSRLILSKENEDKEKKQ
jgi:cobalt/nickel transport system permease protein